MRRALFFVLVLGGAAGGCKSDAATICEKLEECELLPEPKPTKNDKDGFQENDCELQVENELGDVNQEKCADCVTSHPCAQIVDACRAVCNPPY